MRFSKDSSDQTHCLEQGNIRELTGNFSRLRFAYSSFKFLDTTGSGQGTSLRKRPLSTHSRHSRLSRRQRFTFRFSGGEMPGVKL